jgi:hypothetical protein
LYAYRIHPFGDQRDRWLNAKGLSDAEKKKRTLTNLYNARRPWLDLAHRQIDTACR